MNAVLFDILIRIEYKSHNSYWVKDGKPIGFIFVPHEASIFSGSIKRKRLGIYWYFVTPVWVYNDSNAQKILTLYRLAGISIPMYLLSLILFFSFY
ncbi:MAG: hypothetical protein ACR2J3_11355 [Aridibacter sp.]